MVTDLRMGGVSGHDRPGTLSRTGVTRNKDYVCPRLPRPKEAHRVISPSRSSFGPAVKKQPSMAGQAPYRRVRRACRGRRILAKVRIGAPASSTLILTLSRLEVDLQNPWLGALRERDHAIPCPRPDSLLSTEMTGNVVAAAGHRKLRQLQCFWVDDNIMRGQVVMIEDGNSLILW